LLQGNRDGAVVAGLGFATTLLPLIISHFSKRHVPRLLELTFVAAMFFQYVSESFKLFEIFSYWDKLVHPAEIFLAGAVATYLLLGYRELHELDIPDGLAAAGAMLFGMALGASWELVEFALDWFGNANLQKSNADTMTDILANDAGAIFGPLLAFWLYRHRTTEEQRHELGEIAEWLTGRLARLFEKHGVRVGIGVGLAIAAIVLAGWLMDRRPLPPGPPGEAIPASWDFTANPNSAVPEAILLGDWRQDARGICKVNDPPVRPGSEKMGLLGLAPDVRYGGSSGFVATTTFYSQRPELGAGSAMDTGLAFGLRDADNFYLVKASALHDTYSLERYIGGRRRDLREERVRFRGNEWHELRIEISSDQATVFHDGRQIFEERGLEQTDGGVALWARVTTAGCFAQATVQPSL
jgi:MFS family permease